MVAVPPRHTLANTAAQSAFHAGNDDDRRTGSTPQVGAIICWTDGGYGHVGVVTHVESTTRIQIKESNYAGKQYIGNFRGWFNPYAAGQGAVSYIYPK